MCWEALYVPRYINEALNVEHEFWVQKWDSKRGYEVWLELPLAVASADIVHHHQLPVRTFITLESCQAPNTILSLMLHAELGICEP